MTDIITLTGLVATTPRHLVTGEGLPITSFRLASTQRRYDRSNDRWVDGETNWYTITAFRQLAINITASLDKGHRVLVPGRLRIRDWTNGEKAGTNIEVDAEAIGHDLLWGTTTFTRSIATALAESSGGALAEHDTSTDAEADLEGDDGADDVVPAGADAALTPAEPVAVPF